MANDSVARALAVAALSGGGGSGEVTSVNGKKGAVVLRANDVHALPDTTVIPTKTSDLTNDSGFIDESALDGYALEEDIPTKTSDLTNDSGFVTEKPYTSLRKIGNYTYEATFESIPEYVPQNDSLVNAGCTAFVKDGKLHRFLDYKYDNMADFHVITNDFEGMAFINGLNDNGDMSDELIGQLPYNMVDGVNRDGIKVCANILFNDFDLESQGDANIPLTYIPYYILSEVHSMDEINKVQTVLNNIKIPESEYIAQWLVTDETTTYVISPTSNGYEIVDATENPKLTNFKWVADTEVDRTDLQDRPVGVERWNSLEDLTSDIDKSDYLYTHAYDEDSPWLSEFIGIDGTTKDSTDEELREIQEEAREEFLTRTRDGETWHTLHIVEYSGSKLQHLLVQEKLDNDLIGVNADYIDLDNRSVATAIYDLEDETLIINERLGTKQDTLTAGDNITIENNVISAEAGSEVSVSATGTATDEVGYITIDGVEKKLAGGGGGGSYTFTNGLTESGGTVSWDLNPFITANLLPSAASDAAKVINVGRGPSSFTSASLGGVSIGAFNRVGPISGNGEKCAGPVAIGYNNYCGGTTYGPSSPTQSGLVAIGKDNHVADDTYKWSASGCVAIGYFNEMHSDREDLYGTVLAGNNLKSNSSSQFVCGRYNINDNTSAYGFILGNGDSTAYSNAFTVDWQGNGVFAGTVTPTGADYCEYFEWKDGNPDDEDRMGYLVTLDGKNIVMANGEDVLGITSGTKAVIGDSYEMNWEGKYVKDELGRCIYEDYDIEHPEVIDPETGEVIEPAWTEHIHARKISPDYDPTREYKPRSQRKEWYPVGLLGKLYVRDDGTCEVGGYIKADNGIATKSEDKTNMRVLERVNDHIIRVLVK